MYADQRELAYRRTALAGATPAGMTIALYDTLSGNLRRASNAIQQGLIEKRCAEMNHALLVIGQLESMSGTMGGDELAGSLSLFYTHLRSKMMEASVKQSAPLLEAQLDLVLQVRAAWQQRDSLVSQPVAANVFSTDAPASAFGEGRSLSQSM